VAWSHQLGDAEALEYTTGNIFSAANFPPGDDDYLIYWETRFKNHQNEPYLEYIVFRADGDWPVKPTVDWVPDIASDSVYLVLQANTRMFLDSVNLDAGIAGLKLNGDDLPETLHSGLYLYRIGINHRLFKGKLLINRPDSDIF
jgi:hypothetical protein